jgi:hypothetical protein
MDIEGMSEVKIDNIVVACKFFEAMHSRLCKFFEKRKGPCIKSGSIRIF